MITIKCLMCGKERKVFPSDIEANRGKFCSQKCYWKHMVGKPAPNPFKKGHPTWNKGTKGVCKTNSGSFKKGIIPWNKGLPIEQQPCYKTGTTHSSFGYILIRKKGKYVGRCRLVAEKCLNRSLKSAEVIHHINKVKDDDSPENLYLFSSQSEHTKFHHSEHILLSNITIR